VIPPKFKFRKFQPITDRCTVFLPRKRLRIREHTLPKLANLNLGGNHNTFHLNCIIVSRVQSFTSIHVPKTYIRVL